MPRSHQDLEAEASQTQDEPEFLSYLLFTKDYIGYLADIVIHRVDHEAAHQGDACWAVEICSILRCLGVAVVSKCAADTKPRGTATICSSSSLGALRASVTSALDIRGRGALAVGELNKTEERKRIEESV